MESGGHDRDFGDRGGEKGFVSVEREAVTGPQVDKSDADLGFAGSAELREPLGQAGIYIQRGGKTAGAKE